MFVCRGTIFMTFQLPFSLVLNVLNFLSCVIEKKLVATQIAYSQTSKIWLSMNTLTPTNSTYSTLYNGKLNFFM